MSAVELSVFVERAERLFVITGAGCSAPSGIDTYRDDAGNWRRSDPIQHQDFLNNHKARARYWLRSMRGWPSFRDARPNAGHEALVSLEGGGRIQSLVTQNVDGLHQRAGHKRLIELHGSLGRVVCMDCAAERPRDDLQAWLESSNGAWLELPVAYRPDGDAEVFGVGRLDDFILPECACGGILKPDVVFYGDSVPGDRVSLVRAELQRSDALLVVGSSLMVYSSYRFLKDARRLGLPMAAINLGTTRADDWFDCKWEADCAVALPQLLRAI